MALTLATLPVPRAVLFVCMGNICRSPLAEAVFRAHVEKRGVASRYHIDSAGTHGYHEGEPADARSIAVGRRHGIEVTSISREVRPTDFHSFHLIIAMDDRNLRELRLRNPKAPAQLRRMGEWIDPEAIPEVPDPYYGRDDGFERVYQMLEVGCARLLAEFEDERR